MDKYLKNVKDFLKEYKQERKQKKVKEKQLFAYIESGKFKGKKLILPSLNTTRSTKSIVKACVFNVIRNDLHGKIFIEAFGGSSSMAAEAISNYAKKAYAIEKDLKAYEIACKNAKNIDENLIIIKGDTFEILPNLTNKEENLIIYLDPPFDIRDGYKNIYEKLYDLIKNINEKNVLKIIIEHNSNIKTKNEISNFIKTKTKKFGLTSLSFYDKNYKILGIST